MLCEPACLLMFFTYHFGINFSSRTRRSGQVIKMIDNLICKRKKNKKQKLLWGFMKYLALYGPCSTTTKNMQIRFGHNHHHHHRASNSPPRNNGARFDVMNVGGNPHEEFLYFGHKAGQDFVWRALGEIYVSGGSNNKTY